ncbi:uncharacterized protein BCR38DRAFT_419187 [Pseudomassariella vexata]|uniref:Uncharacterized protein n=1 Tax=Pseudomassariella vexata TaxID=1141098 RepID=A0A1Y2EKX6_9PEZI|nr:uncharacterized protein BCR38DRAFT_419187 [Pseudomassariella vexata]ORY72189.1 hypothetical protein BCR38DRAFT_419187 [Pseudomassariella vexata]
MPLSTSQLLNSPYFLHKPSLGEPGLPISHPSSSTSLPLKRPALHIPGHREPELPKFNLRMDNSTASCAVSPDKTELSPTVSRYHFNQTPSASYPGKPGQTRIAGFPVTGLAHFG